MEKLEEERRASNEERASLLSAHTRIKTQLEVLGQAEQSLAGYAEGARFLLEAVQQMKLKGARGALSAALDVPAELETAIAAALGDTLDAVLLDANEIEDALRLLESDDAGRAVLLPLEENNRQLLARPNDENCLGLASELVNAPDDLRAAVNLMLGQTLVVRDRSTARRLIQDLPNSCARCDPARGSLPWRWLDRGWEVRFRECVRPEPPAPEKRVDQIPVHFGRADEVFEQRGRVAFRQDQWCAT